MRHLLIALLATLTGGLPLVAQVPKNTIAFGDSITRGDKRFDEQNRGGYPGRLQGKLRSLDPMATVHNFGRDSEITSEGLSRIDSVFNQVSGDAFVLIEGTNDINLVIEGLISFESIGANLAAMANKAENRGAEVTLGTIIPRPGFARKDSTNVLTSALARGIRDIAFRQGRSLVDVYDLFFYEPSADLYSRAADDAVGHPNALGFAKMADAFFDSLTGVDSQAPVSSEMLPGFGVNRIGAGELIELTVYDLGAGIDADNVTLTINGDPVATDHTGSERRRILTHDATADSLGCYTRLGFMVSDLADPPNVADKVIKEFSVNGGTILRGDLNKSCRVDGVDLLIVALAFGAIDGEPRYSNLADINGDGRVNGMDFAALASNFGRDS